MMTFMRALATFMAIYGQTSLPVYQKKNKNNQKQQWANKQSTKHEHEQKSQRNNNKNHLNC